MDADKLLTLLEAVAAGTVPPRQALEHFQTEPFTRTLSGLNLDTQRRLRTGLTEVVFAPGKNLTQLREAVAGLGREGQPVLVTRLETEPAGHLLGEFSEAEYWPEARLLACNAPELRRGWPAPTSRNEAAECLILSAGGADLPVALEALGVARFLGLDAELAGDVGVAGLHRIEPYLAALRKARVCIVCAGMEGALPSVLGGLVSAPIIAVPTSVGYGASFGGLAALLAMLNSCAPGVAVVNIDNGFGAAAMARKILRPTPDTPLR
jgi:pyridinium-3,5-biscarboxylic acid mononucleotide synthase